MPTLRTAVATLISVLGLLWLLCPPLSTPKHVVDRRQREDKLRQISNAIIKHAEEHGHFPSATTNGLSWRVSLLPYLGEHDLFERINKTAAWDHPDNLAAHDQMPLVYRDPSDETPGVSSYVAITGTGTPWPTDGKLIGFRDVSDGLSLTISVLALPGNSSNWLAPEVSTIEDVHARMDNSDSERVTCAFLDGHVTTLKLNDLNTDRGSKLLIADSPRLPSTK